MSRSCKECAHHNPDFIDKVCLHCSWPEFAGEPSNFKPKPVTNADRIRSMTDEELAEWIFDRVKCQNCHMLPCVKHVEDGNGNCKGLCIAWLKQEAE